MEDELEKTITVKAQVQTEVVAAQKTGLLPTAAPGNEVIFEITVCNFRCYHRLFEPIACIFKH